jgi:hypothetical protein
MFFKHNTGEMLGKNISSFYKQKHPNQLTQEKAYNKKALHGTPL